MIKDRLISTKMLEKNKICFTISLYSHETDDGKVFFSYFGDYLGFGLNTPDKDYFKTPQVENFDRIGQILSGKKDICTPKSMTQLEYLTLQNSFIKKMDELQFEDILLFIENKI